MWHVPKHLVYLMTPLRRQGTDCESQVPKHHETGREWFANGVNFLKKVSLVNLPSQPKEKTFNDTRVSSDEESADLPVFAERSTQASPVACGSPTKIARVREPPGSTRRRRIVKVSMRGKNLVCSIVAHSWCRIVFLLDPMLLHEQ